MAKTKTTVDASQWINRNKKLMNAIAPLIKKWVDTTMDNVHKDAVLNLSGPHYNPLEGYSVYMGTYPVPRPTGTLRRSMKKIRVNPTLGIVHSDDNVANYNEDVHDGDKKHKPRRFLKDAMVKHDAPSKLLLQEEIDKAIKDAGLD